MLFSLFYLQAFFNPGLLKLADAFAQGDQLRLRHMKVPRDMLHRASCRHRSGGTGAPAAGLSSGPSPMPAHQAEGEGVSSAYRHGMSEVPLFVQEASPSTANKPSPGDEASGAHPYHGGCGCKGCSWPRVFVNFVLTHRVVPLGLFRDRRWKAAALPYVHTNPAVSARCRPGDVVFVILRL